MTVFLISFINVEKFQNINYDLHDFQLADVEVDCYNNMWHETKQYTTAAMQGMVFFQNQKKTKNYN